jgi:hypothetical protein
VTEIPPADGTRFFVHGSDGKQYPATEAKAKEWVSSGRIVGATQVYDTSINEWKMAREIPELFPPAPPVATSSACGTVALAAFILVGLLSLAMAVMLLL